MRSATAADAADGARLVIQTAPAFLPAVFGPLAPRLVARCFAGKGNLLSHEHAVILEQGGRVAGLALGYSHDEVRGQVAPVVRAFLGLVGAGVVGYIGRLLALRRYLANPEKGEYYLCNIAVYPEFQGQGGGALLLAEMDRRARAAGCSWIVLDAEQENESAIELYRRVGYGIARAVGPRRVAGKLFAAYRMRKKLGREIRVLCG